MSPKLVYIELRSRVKKITQSSHTLETDLQYAVTKKKGFEIFCPPGLVKCQMGGLVATSVPACLLSFYLVCSVCNLHHHHPCRCFKSSLRWSFNYQLVGGGGKISPYDSKRQIHKCLFHLLPKYRAEMENVCHVQIPQLTSSVGQET